MQVVEGHYPEDMRPGVLVRNGPNPIFYPSDLQDYIWCEECCARVPAGQSLSNKGNERTFAGLMAIRVSIFSDLARIRLSIGAASSKQRGYS